MADTTFEYLSGRGTRSAVVCGRNAIQIMPTESGRIDLEALAERLGATGVVERSQFLLKFDADDCSMTIFPDGRAIVAGTTDAGTARTLYSRYIGA